MAVIPSAPLLVPGLAAGVPPTVEAVADRVRRALATLPQADILVLLAAGPAGAVHEGPVKASLAAVGAPAVALQAEGHDSVRAIARALEYPLREAAGLPLDLATLALLAVGASLGEASTVRDGGAAGRVAASTPMMPITVPAGRTFDDLQRDGAALARGLADAGLRAAVIAAGDLSAALRASAPVYLAEGSKGWDEQALAAAQDGLADLRALGPGEALRVGARGWAPLSMLRGMLEASALRLARPWYAAPCGVGYLVARDG